VIRCEVIFLGFCGAAAVSVHYDLKIGKGLKEGYS
jgi:hypothetical protein